MNLFMPTVKRFEELQVWQMANEQCAAFYKLVENKSLAGHQPLGGQMDRSSASVMDNIAEGFDRFTKADFRHFLVIARGSNAEFRSQLYRAFERAVVDLPLFEQLKTNSEHLGVRLHHFIAYLTKTEFKNKPDSKQPDNNDANDGLVQEPPFIYHSSGIHEYPLELLA